MLILTVPINSSPRPLLKQGGGGWTSQSYTYMTNVKVRKTFVIPYNFYLLSYRFPGSALVIVDKTNNTLYGLVMNSDADSATFVNNRTYKTNDNYTYTGPEYIITSGVVFKYGSTTTYRSLISLTTTGIALMNDSNSDDDPSSKTVTIKYKEIK